MDKVLSNHLTDRQTFNARNSGIELLKILAIFFILIHHFGLTLTIAGKKSIPYLIDLKKFAADRPGAAYVLTLFQSFGRIGNYIFLICSIWFLLDSNKKYGRKICSLLTDVWFVSVSILAVVLLSATVYVNGSTILRCIFPSVFSNNWYITRYVLFLAVLPYLNIAVSSLSQRKHLIAVLYLLAGKLVINAFIAAWGGDILGSMLFNDWTVFYLAVAYIKKYLLQFQKNTKINVLLLMAIVCFLYMIPRAIDVFKMKCYGLPAIFNAYWSYSDFIYELIAIPLFNIFRNIDIKSNIINRISKQSLLIYVIHDNLLLRTYYRPLVWKWVYENIGYEHVVGLVIILAVLTFMGSLALSLLYEKTLGRLSKKISEIIYTRIESVGIKVTDRLIKIK